MADRYLKIASNCTRDEDCEGSLLCYANVSWAPDEVFCGCSTYYGWVGDNCDEFSYVSYLMAGSEILLIVLALGFAVLTLRDIVQLLLIPRQRSFSAGLLTQISLFISFMFFIVWKVGGTLNVLQPDQHDELHPTGEKRGSAYLLVRIGLPVSQTFLLLAASYVSVLWIELADAANSLKNKVISDIDSYRKRVFALNLVYLTTVSVCAILARFDLIGLLASPFVIFLIVTYSLGRCKLVALLNHVASQQESYGNNSTSKAESYGSSVAPAEESAISQVESGAPTSTSSPLPQKKSKREKTASEKTRRSMLSIKRCSFHVILSLILLLSAGMVYVATSSKLISGEMAWKAYAPPATFNLISLVNELIPWFSLYTTATIALYCHRNASKLIRKAHGKSSFGRSKSTTDNTDYSNSKPTGTFTKTTNEHMQVESFKESFASFKEQSIHSDDEDEYV